MTLCSLNSGITVLSPRKEAKILIYCMIIGIREYTNLFTQRLLAALHACKQNDLKRRLIFFTTNPPPQCVIRSVRSKNIHQCNYCAVELTWCELLGESL